MLPAPSLNGGSPCGRPVDMFYYDQEEFWFHDGRLLLRGNNGTGKSKVLALTLPFLLDGDLAPHRVEPDGDRQKRMEWNLLLGGRHPSPERLGYTWLEFGRKGADGTEEFCTIGCGLKAVAGRASHGTGSSSPASAPAVSCGCCPTAVSRSPGRSCGRRSASTGSCTTGRPTTAGR